MERFAGDRQYRNVHRSADTRGQLFLHAVLCGRRRQREKSIDISVSSGAQPTPPVSVTVDITPQQIAAGGRGCPDLVHCKRCFLCGVGLMERCRAIAGIGCEHGYSDDARGIFLYAHVHGTPAGQRGRHGIAYRQSGRSRDRGVFGDTRNTDRTVCRVDMEFHRRDVLPRRRRHRVGWLGRDCRNVERRHQRRPYQYPRHVCVHAHLFRRWRLQRPTIRHGDRDSPSPLPASITAFTATPSTIQVRPVRLARLGRRPVRTRVARAAGPALRGQARWASRVPVPARGRSTPRGSYTFTLTCTGPGGPGAPNSAIVNVNSVPAMASIIAFTATPSTLSAGQSASLSWSTNGATSCTAGGGTGSDGWGGTVGTSSTGTSTGGHQLGRQLYLYVDLHRSRRRKRSERGPW